MSSNRLRLNPHKTQYIWLGTRQQLDKLDSKSLSAEFPTFLFSTSVRDLGVILDQELSFAEHITVLTRSCYLRQIRVVSRSLSSSSTSTLVHIFLANRLDYCSSLYCVLPKFDCNLRTVFCGRLLAWLVVCLGLAISQTTCGMYSTGSQFSSASIIGFPLLSGIVFLVTRLLIFWSSLSWLWPALVADLSAAG